MYQREYASAVYQKTSGGWRIIPEKPASDGNDNKVPWISVDPQNPDYEHHPLFQKAHPLHVEVNPGETLYLPSLWFHQVAQDDMTIAINVWYDMKFDRHYNHFTLFQDLVQSFNFP
eukprot:GFYU01093303.1.p1 GENE.GFYU01093303.1~~GFYU01093303.1.p1  ORF type:complete len:116 (-),score=28.39 GFYU01093303.1:86-433(-)